MIITNKLDKFSKGIGCIPDRTCYESDALWIDAFRIGHVPVRTHSGSAWEIPKNKEVFRIGHVEPSKQGGYPDRIQRALKTRRFSGWNWESPKNKELFRIRLGKP